MQPGGGGLPLGAPFSGHISIPMGLPQGFPSNPLLAAFSPGLAPMVPGGVPGGVPTAGLLQGFGGMNSDASSQAVLLNYQQMFNQQAAVASQFTMHSAQAYEDTVPKEIPAEVKDLQKKFKLDDRITRDLDMQLRRRRDSFDDDMTALWEIMEGARNPAGLLRVKIREMEEGSFRGTATPDRDVEELAKKFKLDAQAAAKLAEVLSKREDRKRDLRQIMKHLELSNRPSSLVMLMLKDLRSGINIKDPEYPAAVGSYAHKKGLQNTRNRSRSRDKRKRRDRSESSSSPPPLKSPTRSTGAGPNPKKVPLTGTRPMTLLERFG